MYKRCQCLVFCLFCVVSVQAQTPSQQVTVDAHLKLTFPGRVIHSDRNGTAAFITTANHTTYQTVHVELQKEVSDARQAEFIEEKARLFMTDQRYDGMTKQVMDSVIGGAKGRFIKMGRPDQSKPLFLFEFITARGKNFYLIRSSSSKPEANAREDARQFFEGVVFQRL